MKHSGTLVWNPASALMPYYTQGLAELSFHGIPAAGYRLVHVDSYERGRGTRYAAYWTDGSSRAAPHRHGP